MPASNGSQGDNLTQFEDTQVLVSEAPAPRLLLVDDDELILAHLETLLATAGYDVTTVDSAAAALGALQKEFTPIVIVDRNMPGMDGLALCRSIRERNYPRYVYLMLLTSQDAERGHFWRDSRRARMTT